MAFSRPYLKAVKAFGAEHRLAYCSTAHGYMQQAHVCRYLLGLARVSAETRMGSTMRIGRTSVALDAPRNHALWFINPDQAPHVEELPELLAYIQMRTSSQIVLVQVHGKVLGRLPAMRWHLQADVPYGTDIWNCHAAFLCAVENMHDPFRT